MIKHIALFTFTDETTEEDILAMENALAGLPSAIAEIKSYSVGRDLGLSGETYDYAVIGEFDSPQTFASYASDPAHIRVLDMYVKPFLEDAVRIQIDVSQQARSQ